MGTLLYSPTVGLAAGLVLTLTREFIAFGARFQLDPALVFFILLSFIFWWKRKPVWMGLAAGIGMWIKNPVSFLVFPSAFIALFLTGTFNRREIKTLLIFSSNCNGWWLINSADFQIHRRIDGFSTGQLTSYPQIVGAPQWTA